MCAAVWACGADLMNPLTCFSDPRCQYINVHRVVYQESAICLKLVTALHLIFRIFLFFIYFFAVVCIKVMLVTDFQCATI